jgi:hypothetical protein
MIGQDDLLAVSQAREIFEHWFTEHFSEVRVDSLPQDRLLAERKLGQALTRLSKAFNGDGK